MDCTIRDGGLINNHYFTDEFVHGVYEALSQSGIDYMEMGYRNSRELFPTNEYGTRNVELRNGFLLLRLRSGQVPQE